MGNDIALSEVTYTEVSKYIMHLYKRPVSRATVSTYVRNIRIFLRWVYIEYELPFDPQKIKVPKSPKKIVHIYNDTEIKEIFALALLDDYFSQCPYKDKPYVFCTRRGQALTNNAVRLFVNRLQHKLPFDLSSHKLRHNFATNYCIDHVRQTGKTDVYDLSILMGHESIETPKKYEHFAHEIIAAENNISHLDMCLGNGQKTGRG